MTKKKGKIINKGELALKIIGIFCLGYFLIQIYAVITLFIVKVIGVIDIWEIFFNFIIMLCSFFTFLNMLPDDYFKIKREK